MKIIRNSILFLSLVVIAACSGKKGSPEETPTTGTTTVYVDETFLPIITEQEEVFESIYAQADVTTKARPEALVLDALIKDSARAAIITRELNKNELDYFKSKKIFPQQLKIASDAVAIIINNNNTDSLYSLEALKRVFSGDAEQWSDIFPDSKLGKIQVVFDNQYSSTLRVIRDSVCDGQALSGNISAVKSNKDVIDYVKKHKNALGLIGVNWISNSKDSSALSFLKDVTVAYVSRDAEPDIENSYQPFQAYIAMNLYPITRNMYFINCGPYAGLAKGFMSFMASQRGQKIIQKAGLLPATMPLRIVKVNNE